MSSNTAQSYQLDAKASESPCGDRSTHSLGRRASIFARLRGTTANRSAAWHRLSWEAS